MAVARDGLDIAITIIFNGLIPFDVQNKEQR